MERKVLVIDRDEVLSKLAEWVVNAKNVDADYKRCIGRPFPTGGSLVEQLPYEDGVAAKDLYDQWIAIYRAHVPYRDGCELTQVESQPGGGFRVACRDAAGGTDLAFYARSVLIAIGLQEAQIDLLGDGEGIHYKLPQPKQLVGAPVCVYGGGMSAAEAVVAIAEAKRTGQDETPVFWCYRGRELEKIRGVPTIAGRLFDAMTYGNIRNMPNSKPFAVVKGDDGQESVFVRVDRQQQPGLPRRNECLEFAKRQTVVLIGAERPDDLLATLGIRTRAAADAPTVQRLAVTAMYETERRGVFLAGSLLDAAYIETSDFDAQLQTTVKEHPGCFKTALLDGTLAAEAIVGRLRGRSDLDITRELVARRRVANSVAAQSERIRERPRESGTSGGGARFTCLGTKERREQRDVVLSSGDNVVGRSIGALVFPDDASLPESAFRLRVDKNECSVLQGVKDVVLRVRVRSERTFQEGTVLQISEQRLAVRLRGGQLCLAHVDGSRPVIELSEQERVVSRENIAPDDRGISRPHFTAANLGDVVYYRDESKNGTYVEVQGSLRLNPGDEVFFGKQRIRFDCVVPAGVETQPIPFGPRLVQGRGTNPIDGVPPAPREISRPCLVLEGGTELEVADPSLPILHMLWSDGRATSKAKEMTNQCRTLWQCWEEDNPRDPSATCGKCVVTILEGMENVTPMESKERNTLEKKRNQLWAGKLDMSKCRLSCCALVTGRVRIVQNGAPPQQ